MEQEGSLEEESGKVLQAWEQHVQRAGAVGAAQDPGGRGQWEDTGVPELRWFWTEGQEAGTRFRPEREADFGPEEAF